MAFTHVFADAVSIYAATQDGSLLWYRDDLKSGGNGANAQRGWAAASGAPIGTGWTGFKQVFAGDDGVIYAVRRSGELVWSRDLLRDGSNGAAGQTGWAAASGNQIRAGFGDFRSVFSGGAGVIYAIKEAGELFFFQDTLRDGSNGAAGERGWAAGSGRQIGDGWADFEQVFYGGDGVIYAVKPSGELLWYRDIARDGSNAPDGSSGWAPRSGSPIGTGWGGVHAFSPGDGSGVIYAATATSNLMFYRDALRDGGNGAAAGGGWAAGSESPIGHGWTIQAEQSVQGYAWPLSAPPGGTIALQLSASAACAATMQLVRLLTQDDGSVGVPIGDPQPVQLQLQPVPADAWQNGCGWSTTLSLTLPAALVPGLYSARVTVDADNIADIVFVVRPAAPTAPILVIGNTNCWNAYNDWGGTSNYTANNTGITLSFLRPNPGTYVTPHLAEAEIWLLTWLDKQKVAVDVCSDADLHANVLPLSAYKVLVLNTHPEYWSHQMAVTVQTYLNTGGCLIYLGGNGVYRIVDYSTDGVAMMTGNDPPHHCAVAWDPAGPLPRSFLGVGSDPDIPLDPNARCGFVVDDAAHRFMQGTKLANGDVFGLGGANGGAVGWEVDCASAQFTGGPAPAGVQILAHGQQVTKEGYRCDMTYYDAAGGGFVLSAGSITVTGTVGTDPQLGQLVMNALNAAVAR